MIFSLWVLMGSPRAEEITTQDKKVIEYLLEKEKVSKTSDDQVIPEPLQKEISEVAKPTNPNGQQFPELGQSWMWGVLFMLLVLGAVRWILPPKKEKIGNLRVQSRSFFGQEGSLAVVEVQDAQNNPRLYLVGLHSKGSPRFLADLSAPLPFPELEVQTPQPPMHKQEDRLIIPKESSPESTREKEELVARVLRMRDQKTIVEHESIPKKSAEPTSSVDPWAEGFNEMLRK